MPSHARTLFRTLWYGELLNAKQLDFCYIYIKNKLKALKTLHIFLHWIYHHKGKSIFVSMPKNLAWTQQHDGLKVTIMSEVVVYASAERAKKLLYPFSFVVMTVEKAAVCLFCTPCTLCQLLGFLVWGMNWCLSLNTTLLRGDHGRRISKEDRAAFSVVGICSAFRLCQPWWLPPLSFLFYLFFSLGAYKVFSRVHSLRRF